MTDYHQVITLFVDQGDVWGRERCDLQIEAAAHGLLSNFPAKARSAAQVVRDFKCPAGLGGRARKTKPVRMPSSRAGIAAKRQSNYPEKREPNL